ncbi:Serine/threonine-protein kinase [Cryptotrichosporon argae]
MTATTFNPLPAHLEAATATATAYTGEQTPSYGGTVTTGSEWEWVTAADGRRSREPSRSPHRAPLEPRIYRASTLSQMPEVPPASPAAMPPLAPAGFSHHARAPSLSLSLPSHGASPAHPPTPSPAYAATMAANAIVPTSAEDAYTQNGRQGVRLTREAIDGRRRGQRMVGEWVLGKTLGAGSMGKVKLGTHIATKEKAAVKVVPRWGDHLRREEPRSAEEAERLRAKDESKEVRTIREAAIMLLLHHPYICGMRDLITHTNHHYMVFEFVDGGQMLDYIIAHGRLRERAARKFARQIASALDYCHRNSVVHRDLKIENILITKSGNLKIIDFGLSNLYAPDAHLRTFCGSLYFAAPELLNAMPYTGPEVDLWSFGIVLYVLTVGKVPFDDQSMPALHAKIKRGFVEYPSFLSVDAKNLLQRMLTVNPAERATLDEIIHHPWMNKGFDGPVDSHLIMREPLRADELDMDVVQSMGGFGFGAPDEILGKLRAVLQTETYALCVAAWEARRELRKFNGGSMASTSSMTLSGDSAESPKKRRFSGFDLKRKMFGKEDKDRRADDAAPAAREKDVADPTRGFHPLISIYYLAREKIERERVYGHGHFASASTTSVDGLGGRAGPRAQHQQQQSYSVPVPAVPAPPSSLATGYDDPQPFQPRARTNDVPNPVMQHPAAAAEQSDIADVPHAHHSHRRQSSMQAASQTAPASPLQPSAFPAYAYDDDRRRNAASLGRGATMAGGPARPPSAPGRSSSTSAGRSGIAPSPSMPATASTGEHRRAATVADKKHERRVSVGSLSSSMGKAAISRRPSQKHKPSTPPPEQWPSPREADEAHVGAASVPIASGRGERKPAPREREREYAADVGSADVKNVYIKGLFSVATTSSKPPGELLDNIASVLDRIGIKRRPIKAGYECLHLPSIDLASVVIDDHLLTPPQPPLSASATPAPSPRRRVSLRRKPDAFAAPTNIYAVNANAANANGQVNGAAPARPSGVGAGVDGPGYASRGASPSPGPRTHGSSGTISGGEPEPATPRTREDDEAAAWAVAEGAGAGLCVRFEVTVVKVPFLPLHGITFHRISGDGWQYQQLAKTILREMRL